MSEGCGRKIGPFDCCTVVEGDCLDVMAEMPTGCVDLVVTSPPYFNAREYSQWETYESFLSFLMSTWKLCHDVVQVGGRVAINTCQGYGRQPYTPIGSDVTKQIQGLFILRGHIIWDKHITGGTRQRTSWGSWLSASNPYLRDSHEQIVVASKQQLGKLDRGESDIERDEFLQWTESVWHMAAASATRVGHPAPFPEELPKRLIKLFSYVGDLVFDPFFGSGTSLIVARDLGRHFFGCDIKSEYVEMARKRLSTVQMSYLT